MHWCLGTYASASTWVYNVTLKVAAALYPDHAIIRGFVTSRHEIDFPKDSASIQVIKTHDVDTDSEPFLAQLADTILISIRDPRDCLASMLNYQKLSVDDALGKLERSSAICARLANHPRALLLRYEDSFYDNPHTIDHIARTFDRELETADRNWIFGETRRGAVEALIAGLESLSTVYHHVDPLETLDLATQWHRHHAGRTGEIGRWRRELSESHLCEIEQRLGPFMARFAYATS